MQQIQHAYLQHDAPRFDPMSAPSHLILPIKGMTCAACVNRVEKVLNRLPGVTAQVSLATELAHVEVAPEGATAAQIESAIRAAGYEVREPRRNFSDADDTRTFAFAFLLTLPFVVQMGVMVIGGAHDWLPPWLQLALATPMQFWVGARFYRGAWYALRGGVANMDVLVAVGTTAAFGYSVFMLLGQGESAHYYFEASVFIIAFVLLGKMLEIRARRHTNDALKDLARLLPGKAILQRGGEWVEVEVDQVPVGAVVVIRAQERAPVDGEVIEGESEMDESLITGESMLATKSPGAQVFAGARNEQGQLIVRAIRVGGRTHMAEVVRLVETAQASKAPIQHLADRIAGVFVPVMLVISVLTGLVWWSLTQDIEPALVNAIAVLVIACPCALGLATPTAVVVGMGRGAQNAILLRDARALQTAGSIDLLAVDKTGTLTEGQPSVTAVMPAPGYDERTVLHIAASMEAASAHPLARAIVEHARAADIAISEPGEVISRPGHGLRAVVDEQVCLLGSQRFLSDQGIDHADEWAGEFAGRAQTQVWVARAGALVGCVTLTDALRVSSSRAVADLRSLGVEVMMLTGDRAEVASGIAAELRIAQFKSQVLPSEKAAAVQSLQHQGLRVGMAGDGVNDGPALVQADVGFAMGAGADLAVQSADVTLMRNDLMGVVHAIKLSRATMSIVRQNLFFAFVYNLVCVPAAAAGLLNPIIASAAMALSSVTVVANSLRLRAWTPK